MRARPSIAVLAAALVAATALIARAAPSPADAEIERVLARGRVVAAEEIGSGVTRPLRLQVRLDGRTLRAAFKTIEQFKPGPWRQRGMPTERGFTDDYRFERAAYLLDRELGLGMVPVVVLREWQGRKGAAVAWIERAIDERQRRQRGLEPPGTEWQVQRSQMRVFDALILNIDRNLGNQLLTPDDGRLHLIDHSRAFRLSRDLPEDFLHRPVRLTRRLAAALAALEERPLRTLLAGLVSRARVRALLARRDKILRKIEADRATHGEARVFWD